MTPAFAVIDDQSLPWPDAPTGAAWEAVTDGVMGGLSRMRLWREDDWVRMSGAVRLENNGGFIQAALDLAPGGGTVDAGAWRAIALSVRGDGQAYNLHLRTSDLTRPWQSWRATFVAAGAARVILPFAEFQPHRTVAPFNPARLRRIGLLAMGRAGAVDLSFRDLAFVA